MRPEDPPDRYGRPLDTAPIKVLGRLVLHVAWAPIAATLVGAAALLGLRLQERLGIPPAVTYYLLGAAGFVSIFHLASRASRPPAKGPDPG